MTDGLILAGAVLMMLTLANAVIWNYRNQ